MMKVAFWSSAPRNGVTMNTAALACLSVQEYPLRITVTDNCPMEGGLGNVMLSRTQELYLRERAVAYPAYGTCISQPGAYSAYRARVFPDSSLTPIISGKLSYLKRFPYGGPRLYDPEEYEAGSGALLGRKGSLKDICFLDASSSAGGVRILDSADLVVVVLNQDERMVRSFFEEYKALASDAVFLIGNYRRGKTVNRKFLNREFKVPADRMAMIPHSENFALAGYDGDVPGFIERICRERNGENYFFINETRHALRVLIKAMLSSMPGTDGSFGEGRLSVDEFKRGKIVPFDGEYRQ